MKKFWNFVKTPLVVAGIAGLLCVVDALFAGLIFKTSFMWVAFAFWTVFTGSSFKDKIKGLIGTAIGFVAAVVMMLITSSFSINLGPISISCLLGVLLVNFLVMFLDKTKKTWTNSISGIFIGIFLTFSGFGVGMSPIASFQEGAVMFGVLMLYGVIGMACAFFTTFFTQKKESKVENSQEEIVENKTEEGK